MNANDFIETSFQVDDESILITHDAVRPFVTYRIIHDNIVAVKEHGACDTVFPATKLQGLNTAQILIIPFRK